MERSILRIKKIKKIRGKGKAHTKKYNNTHIGTYNRWILLAKWKGQIVKNKVGQPYKTWLEEK